MRITESQLRRIVRDLMEAPLADLAPPRAADERVLKYAYTSYVPSDDIDFSKPGKIFGSSGFKRKLEKLVSGWPQDVWVYPVTVKTIIEGDDRVYVKDPEEIMERGWGRQNSGIAEIVADWMQKSGGRGTLIVPYAAQVGVNVELTPWMLIHAMFDNEFYAGYKFLKTAKSIGYMIEEAVIALETAAKASNSENWAESVERVFTMGSARKKYFSKMDYVDFSDIGHESSVQSLMTKGFHYDRDALEAIRQLARPDDLPKIDEAQAKLDKAESLSSQARQEFLSGINGKVVIINVT